VTTPLLTSQMASHVPPAKTTATPALIPIFCQVLMSLKLWPSVPSPFLQMPFLTHTQMKLQKFPGGAHYLGQVNRRSQHASLFRSVCLRSRKFPGSGRHTERAPHNNEFYRHFAAEESDLPPFPYRYSNSTFPCDSSRAGNDGCTCMRPTIQTYQIGVSKKEEMEDWRATRRH
jgi:hypothetical protein